MMKKIVLAKYIVGATASLFLGASLLSCGDSQDVVGGNGALSGGGGGGAISVIKLPDASVRGAVSPTGAVPTVDGNCGNETSETTKTPTDVLLVLDRSGSMNESIAAECCCSSSCRRTISIKMCSDTANCAERWPSLTSAVTTTIAQTTGINWGLKLFSSPGGLDVCAVGSGVEAGIGASAATMQAQIAGANPLNSTPTAKAVTTATAYLQTVTDPNDKVMLLATDGEPNCRPGSIDPSTPDVDGTEAAIRAANAAGFKVYVIGIGPSVGNLDNFASAGGTGHYYRATSATELADALMAISKAVSSCTFTMSQSPPDPENIAVYLDGQLVAKDPANGWSFGSSPLTVTLNGASCTSITSGAASKVQVLFGCLGEPPPPQILF
jgi:hypothetical protein